LRKHEIVKMIIVYSVIFFLFGICVGSFLNVLVDRLPEGGSLLSPPSHCPACNRSLARRDMIPIISYLVLRGRCRYCGVSIPQRLFWVELGTGILLVLLYLYYDLKWELALVIVYSCILLSLLLIDLERRILPNKIVYPGIILALIVSGLGSIFSFQPVVITHLGFKLWVIDSLVGAVTGFGLLFIIALIFRGGMGWGDVKFAGMIGMMIGFPLVIVALFIAIVMGGLVAGILLIMKIKKRKEMIPFGPFLAAATIVTMLYGERILFWYLGYF
jgi:leader peptidase (prepilin peptidase)/N-methyltransferase